MTGHLGTSDRSCSGVSVGVGGGAGLLLADLTVQDHGEHHAEDL